MSVLALQPAARSAAASGSAPAVLAQRRSTFDSPGAIAAPPLRDAGRPLEPATRAAMESGFGRDFGQVRVHDDAPAHDNARALNALAYAACNDLVFGEGHYRPGTSSGDALIAHELAHSVQQGGVQLKAEGPLPAIADARLEAEADGAAQAVTAGRPAPALSAAPAPAIFRATDPPVAGTDPAAAPTAKPPETAPATRLPPGMTVIRDDPPGEGTNELVVVVQSFTLPKVKGSGDWVQKAYTEAAGGQRLVFSPLIEGGRVAAYLEDSKTDVYAGIWHRNFGFPTLPATGKAILAAAETKPAIKDAIDPLKKPAVRKIVNGLAAGSLKSAGCNIDHVVEKQMGGTSIPSNLQLLDATKNQASGLHAYLALKALVEQIRDPAHRGSGVRNIQLVLNQATVSPDTLDPSVEVETLLRSGAVKDKADIAEAAGKPVALSAGGVGETVRLQDKDKSAIEESAKRIVPGMKLSWYMRGAAGPASKVDKVDGQLDNRAIRATGVSDAESHLSLEAELAPAAPIGAAAAGEARTENEAAQAPAGERRVLKLPKAPKKVKFFYPYLSPGYLISYSLDDKGQLSGEGYITPSVKFLGDIKIAFGPDKLDMLAPIDVAQVNSSKFMTPLKPTFRFTEGSISIDLIKFKPTGELKFTVGPAAKPLLNGALTAGLDGGMFSATGTLAPAGTIPGISAAEGKAGWKSDTGWWGEIRATSSSIPKSTVNAKLGFNEVGGEFKPYGEGGITTQVKGGGLTLKLGWSGGAISYLGGLTVQDPLPLVKSVRLDGSYANKKLTLSGEAPIKWRNIDATMAVTYSRKDSEEEGQFSGKADVTVKTEKMEGVLKLNFDEAGNWWGGGSLAYQVTPSIRPKLGVDVGKDRRIKMFGAADIGTIPLSKKWPSEKGGELPIIKGVGVKFSIPAPPPVSFITAFGEIRGSLSVAYSVGPVQLVGVSFNGELYPFEDDPKVKAQLKGRLAVPGYGELRGTFGASIGVEVALGAVGAKGGIDVMPALGVRGEGAVEVDAGYEQGGFSFSAEAYAKGQMYARVSVDLRADVYAAWGALSHTWTYPVAAVQKNLGPELKVTLGKIAYARDGTITWPNPSQIEVSPKELDPLGIVKELMSEGKATEK